MEKENINKNNEKKNFFLAEPVNGNVKYFI